MGKLVSLFIDSKVTNPYYKTKDGKMSRRANITGSEYLRVLEKISNSNFFDMIKLDNNELVNKELINAFKIAFKDFYLLICRIKNFEGDKNNLQNLSSDLIEWIEIVENIMNPKVNITFEIVESLIEIFKNEKSNKRTKLMNILKNDQINMLKNIENNKKNFLNFKNSIESKQETVLYDLIIPYNAITPYMHSFVFHIPEFLDKYKNVNIFNTQGLEKLNDHTTIDFRTSTNKNKKDNKYLSQLFAKRNRIDFYNLNLNIQN